jgi:hypothetical protein
MGYTWKTKDGQELLISEMTDHHLANAVAKLRSMIRAELGSNLNAAYQVWGLLQGEQAEYECGRDIEEMEKIFDGESAWQSIDSITEASYPAFKFLLEEQERRELIQEILL